ncbi:hypothetical protein ACFX2F_039038 [Malus domestica]
MPKEEAVVVVRNGDSEVSLPPVSAGTEYNVKELADDDLTDDHPKVPGWFSDFCPIWPDGGILKEISRHSSVQQIDICEIDTWLLWVYKKYFPSLPLDMRTLVLHAKYGTASLSPKVHMTR